MADFKETCVEYIDVDSYATFCSSERKWINKITKYATSHPDEVQIVRTPEDNCGVIYARVPKNWLKVSPPAKRSLTDEQRAAATERLRSYRSNED